MGGLDIWFSPEKDHQMILNTEKMISFDEGVEQGMAQGVAQAKQEDAINFIKKGIDLKTISECTGISITELEKLKNEE